MVVGREQVIDTVGNVYCFDVYSCTALLTSARGKTGGVKVVLVDLIIPAFDSSREVIVPRRKVLSRLATTMLERAVLKPVLTKIGSFPVPSQCGDAMEGTVVVVVVQDTLDFLA